MASKSSFKDILLQKGDKFALIAGGGVAVILLVVGVMSMASAESPAGKVADFNKEKSRIESGLRQPGDDAPPPPEWVQKTKNAVQKNGDKGLYPTISETGFALAGPSFEPVNSPDMLKENPRVLGIVDYQINLIRAPMLSLDIQETGDDYLIGVLATMAKGEKGVNQVRRDVKNLIDNLGHTRKKKSPAKPKTGFGPGGPGQFGPGGPGQPGVGPGGGQPFTPPGGPMAGGGMPGMESSEAMGNPYGSSMSDAAMTGQRDDKTVKYLSPEAISKAGLPLAHTVYPLHMVLVQADFPLKQQIEEIRRALRIPKPPEGTAGTSPYPGAGGPPGVSGPMGPMGPMPGAPGVPPMGSNGMTTAMTPGANGDAYFDGFEVERREARIGTDINAAQWGSYDHYSEYFTKIRKYKVADEPDDPLNLPFLRYDQKLAAPLPMLADQLEQYPRVTMPGIVEAKSKLEAYYNPKNTTVDEWRKRFQAPAGSDNPYAPFSSSVYGPGGEGAGPGGSPPMGIGSGAFVTPNPMQRGPVPFGPGAPAPGMTGETGYGAQASPYPETDHLLLRFIDPDIKPGYNYQYRVRVRMYNPNYRPGAEDEKNRIRDKLGLEFRQPTDAAQKFLIGPWVAIEQQVTVPSEAFLYAADSSEYLNMAKELFEKYGKEKSISNFLEEKDVQNGRKAVIQVQNWMPQVRIDGAGAKQEPVGTWVVADIPVGAGEYIGKRQLVELPLWSSGAQNYVLRELSGGAKVYNIKDQNNQPKGWPINFRTQSILVDFDGGKTKEKVGNRSDISDDANTELLILRPDGKMLVRSSVSDAEDKNRTARAKTWDEWLKRVKERKNVMTADPMAPMTGGQFNRN